MSGRAVAFGFPGDRMDFLTKGNVPATVIACMSLSTSEFLLLRCCVRSRMKRM